MVRRGCVFIKYFQNEGKSLNSDVMITYEIYKLD